MKLLFVCLGNICRSPTAEGLARNICNKYGIKNLVFDSAGLYDYHTGNTPDKRAINVAKKHMVDISKLRARKIEKKDFEKFDIIFGMDIENVKKLKDLGSESDNIHLYLDFLLNQKNNSVPDPYYGNTEDFEKAYKLIEIGAKAIIEKFGHKTNIRK